MGNFLEKETQKTKPFKGKGELNLVDLERPLSQNSSNSVPTIPRLPLTFFVPPTQSATPLDSFSNFLEFTRCHFQVTPDTDDEAEAEGSDGSFDDNTGLVRGDGLLSKLTRDEW